MILMDTPRSVVFRHFKTTSHMSSDIVGSDGTAELVEFAKGIGLKRKWLQHEGSPREHFDLFDSAISRARRAGAKQVVGRDFIRLVVHPKRAWRDEKALLHRLVTTAHAATISQGFLEGTENAKAPWNPRIALRTMLEVWERLGPSSRPMIQLWLERVIPAPSLTHAPNLVKYLGAKRNPIRRPLMSTYVKSVSSNLKAGCYNVDLGPKTLIIGENGTGKSSIVGAIELALSGRVSDVAGKPSVGTPSALLALAPGREGPLWANLVLDNDEEVTFSMEGRRGSAKTPDRNLPTCVDEKKVFPIREVREAFVSPAKAREFLARHTPSISDEDVLKVLPKPLHDLYVRTAKGVAGQDGMTRLQGVADRAKRKKLDTRSEAKGASAAAESVASEVVPPTAQQVADAGLAVRQAETRLKEAEHVINTAEKLVRARRDLEVAEEHMKLGLELQEQQAAFERGLAMLGLLHKADDKKMEKCPLCIQEVDPAYWQPRAQKIQGIVDKKRPEKLMNGPAVMAKFTEATKTLETVTADYNACVPSGLADAEAGWVDVTFPDSEAVAAYLNGCRELVSRSREKHQELVGRAQAFAATQKVKDKSFEMGETADKWASLEKQCKLAMSRLVKASATAFVKRVNAFISKGDPFALQIGEGTSDVVLFGLERDGVVHSALSGAEFARVTAALAAAVSGDAQIAVVLPMQGDLSAKTLRAVMIALTKVPHQVIMTSPHKPSGRLPKGWTLVDVATLADPEPQPVVDPEPTPERKTDEPAPIPAGLQEGDLEALSSLMGQIVEGAEVAESAAAEEVW